LTIGQPAECRAGDKEPMIYPIGNEKNTANFQPWVTYSVMILCAVVFLTTRFTARTRLGEATRLLEEAIEFHREHPYLELDPRLQEMLSAGGAVETEGVTRARRKDHGSQRADLKFVGLEQMELDGLTRAGFGAVEDTLHGWWGIVPGRFSVNSLVTYMFLHVGWLHLLVNLLVLYLIGPFLEEEWDPWFFAGFYVVAGLVAGMFFAIRYSGLEVPLVGASGATAGVIGACLVRYGKRKIRFGYWAGPNKQGTFSSPAWYILLVWLLRELVSLHLKDVVSPDVVGGWLAYWAHVPGFVFGAATALALRHFGWEARFLRPTGGGSRVLNRAALERALANRQPAAGDDQVWLSLLEGARRAPDDTEAVEALWNVAVDTERTHEAAPALFRLIQNQIQHGEANEAYVNWRELREHAEGSRLPLGLETRLAELLAKQGLAEESADVTRSAGGRANPEMAASALVKLARLTEGEERDRLAEMALSHSGLTSELRKEIEVLVSTAASAGTEAAEPAGGGRRARARRQPAMKVILSVPLAIQDGKIVLEMAKGRRTLALKRVRSVAAASVADADSRRPYHVMDLLLDSSPGGPEPSTVRLETRRFDPRKLVPSERDEADAFLSLVGAVLAGSGATWLLGTDVSRLNTYDSLRAYESALMAVTMGSPITQGRVTARAEGH
jgi:membrane associated rhomboid family serine protease